MGNETRNSKFEKPNSEAATRAPSAGFRVPNFEFPISSFALRLWWRALTVKRPQAAVAVGSLLVGALVSSTLLNLYTDVRRKMTHEFAAYGPNVVLAPRYGANREQGAAAATPLYGVETFTSLMDESVLVRLEPFRRRVAGLSAAPSLYLVVRVDRATKDAGRKSGPSADPDNAVAVGTDFGAMRRLNPNWRLRVRAKALARDTCVIGAHLAAQLHVGVGDVVRLQTLHEAARNPNGAWEVFAISNVLSSGTSEDDQIFVPLAALQDIAGLAGKISLVQLNIPGEPSEVERWIYELSQSFPRLELRPIRQIVYSEGKVLGTLSWLVISLTGLILIITGLCVMATVTAVMLERRKDVAMMKALGSSDAGVMRLLLSEVVALALLGGGAGAILGGGLARGLGQRLFGVTVNVTPWTFPVIVMASVLLAVLAAVFPVQVVRRIQPAAILKGE